MKNSLRQKFTLSFVALLLFLTIFSGILTTGEVQRFYRQRIEQQLTTDLAAIEYLLQHTPKLQNLFSKDQYSYLTGFAESAGLRLTLIDSSGVVLFDSQVPFDSIRTVENHLYREEIQKALQLGHGSGERTSSTVDEPFFYSAKAISHPTVHVVRLAMPLVEMQQVLCGLRWKILLASSLLLLLFALISTFLAGRIATPILHLSRTAELVKKGDLQAHFAKETRDEIGELADILNEMLAKLRQDVIQLRRLEKMRSQFLGNVSHELRTPIFAVQGYLETLLNEHDLDGETQKKFIDKAHNQAVRLNNLFTDLIDISRIESGEMKMNYTAFNAVKWLKKQIDDLQVIADQHHIQLRFANSQGLKKVMVHGDQERLNQVLVNLVENAIKYNRPQGHVEVSSVLLPGEIEITVKDNGRGIPEEHLSRIFERFYRVDKERSRSLGGTGLGLAIVKHIIEAHGGKVEVQSRVGEGSLFRFRLKTAEISENRS